MGRSRSSEQLSDASDTVLVLAIGRWDEEALAEAFRRHGGAVFGVARRILRDDDKARDVAHDAFVRLWYEPERYDPERGTLRTYLLNHAHSRAVDRLRSERRRDLREEEDARRAPTMTDDVELKVWDMTLAAHVREAMDELPEEERRAIEVAYFGGRTYRETAVLLGEPEGTVKSRIRSGLRRLHASLVAVGVAEVEP
jgi:RNA polymerase sigma-70 factor (ECF subfamily)